MTNYWRCDESVIGVTRTVATRRDGVIRRAATDLRSAMAIAVVASLAFPVQTSAQEMEWFASNADFMILDPLPAMRESGFSIAREALTTSEGGADGAGSVVLTLYRDGEVVGRRELEKRGGRFTEVREYDADGGERFVESYRYRPDGTLRSVTRCGPDGSCLSLRYGIASEEVLEDDRRTVARRFDGLLRPVAIETHRADDSVITEMRRYDDSGLIETIVTDGARVETTTYASGRPVERRITDGGRLVESERTTYDGDGRAIRVDRTTRRDESVETTEYTDDGGTVTRLTTNGQIVRETIVRPDGSSEELRYRDGVLIIKVYLENGERLREELFRNGEVVRTRTIQRGDDQ